MDNFILRGDLGDGQNITNLIEQPSHIKDTSAKVDSIVSMPTRNNAFCNTEKGTQDREKSSRAGKRMRTLPYDLNSSLRVYGLQGAIEMNNARRQSAMSSLQHR